MQSSHLLLYHSPLKRGQSSACIPSHPSLGLLRCAYFAAACCSARDPASRAPPSTVSVTPVTMAEPRTRDSTAAATSSAVQTRPRASTQRNAARAASYPSPRSAGSHVPSMKPGATPTTRVPDGASVRARPAVRASRAAFEQEYGKQEPCASACSDRRDVNNAPTTRGGKGRGGSSARPGKRPRR